MIGIPKKPLELQNGYKDKNHLAKVAKLGFCFACRVEKAPRPGRLEIHHLIGCGLGKKASDLLSLLICNFHHTSGGRGHAVHSGVFKWEEKFGTQESLILEIHELLGITIYRDYLNNINN